MMSVSPNFNVVREIDLWDLFRETADDWDRERKKDNFSEYLNHRKDLKIRFNFELKKER